MDASAEPADLGKTALSVASIQNEIKSLIREDGARRWPLAELYAPSLLAYDSRRLPGIRDLGDCFRSAARGLRDFFVDAIYSSGFAAKTPRIDVLMLAMEARQASNHYLLAAWLERRGIECAILTESRRPATAIKNSPFSLLRAEKVAGFKGLLSGIWDSVSLFLSCGGAFDQTPERAWLQRRLRLHSIEGGRLFARAACILDKLKPKAIVSCDDCDPRARAILLEARRRRIPTVVIQFGMAGPYHVEWSHLAANTVAALGEQQAKQLQAHGIAASRLVVTGSPRFDEAASLRNLNLPSTVLFASQPDAAGCFGGENRRIVLLRDIYEGLRKANKEVIVRPHPDESIEVHERLVSAAGLRARIIVPATQTTLDALRQCGILLTFHSTVALEAALAGRPVIFYRPIGKTASPAADEFVNGAVNAGWAQLAKGPDHLADILKNSALRATAKGQLDDYSFNSDGLATQRVGELILRQLGR